MPTFNTSDLTITGKKAYPHNVEDAEASYSYLSHES